MAAQEEADSTKSESKTPTRPKSFESPTHPKRVSTQPRAGTRSNTGSPMSERNSAGAAPSTPSGSRLRQVTLGDDSPDDSTVVPAFGDWDDSDPASAEGYSHIFNKVREEKHGGGGKSPRVNANDSSYYGQRSEAKKGCGCFPWGKK
ncbi:hypothetical protein L2E82_04703 [Cichorium intybus]|uniref:Uncharacterized protein n=1 Tax=Cichorium intybus TaxID=13427 RepID=A0ACB9H5R7_CICIN|nr:hypothetical protein L2E82_04703 [Cichorium intybus]